MAIIFEALQCMSVFFSAIVAGGFLLLLLAVRPTFGHLPPGPSVLAHQVLGARARVMMIGTGLVSGNCGLALLVLLSVTHGPMPPRIYLVAGSICILVVATITARLILPLDHLIEQWSPEAVPDDYLAIYQRWDQAHRIRAAFGVLALLSYVLCAVLM